jgi:EAL domain-containing protein (putative c-di-GMP-specific phosphodiesterase class I)
VASRHASGVGVDAIEFFSDEMERSFKKTSELEASLEHAIDAGELRLEYQPIVDAQTRELVAGEALIRWTSPLRGAVPPDVFIPIAEESGLIQRLSDWVVERAFADVASWREAGLVPVRVSVNIPASQVSGRLSEKIGELLRDGRARPEDIGIELTESDQLVGSEGAQRVLAEIRAMGLTISIDDFGTGYSSLDYLRRFKVDVVKIDRSFLQGVPDDEGDCDLTRAAIAVGRALGLRTIAEGCETEAQLQFLRESECDSVQGYLFGASMSTTDFAKLIADANQGVGSEL